MYEFVTSGWSIAGIIYGLIGVGIGRTFLNDTEGTAHILGNRFVSATVLAFLWLPIVAYAVLLLTFGKLPGRSDD